MFARTNARGLRGACRHVDQSDRFALEEEMGDVGNCIDVSQHRGASTASTGHRDLSGHLRIRARTNTQAYRVHVSLIRILVCTIAFLRTSRAMPRKYVTVVSRMWFYSCIHTAYVHVRDQMNERKKIAAGAAAFAKG